jgi:hypothetical protein
LEGERGCNDQDDERYGRQADRRYVHCGDDDPHHQGAIDMAISELRYGKNEQLRRIAQEIIVDQLQEIAAMKLAIGEPATGSAPAPTQQQPASAAVEHHHSGMHMDMSPGMKN